MTLDDDTLLDLRDRPGSTASELAGILDASRRDVSAALRRLSTAGLVVYARRRWWAVEHAPPRAVTDARAVTDRRAMADRAAAADTEAHRLRYLARPATVEACAEAWRILPASAGNWLSRARRRGVVVSEYRDGVVTWRAK